MMNIQLLVDLGSTFTKVVAIDLDAVEIISRTQAPSTVDVDVTIGLREALNKISDAVDMGSLQVKDSLACTSAAGGLRVVSIGLVPELSCEAATRTALGAGAKVIGHYSYELTREEVFEIRELSPDLILLAGGTNGGDKRVITHNAKMLADCRSLESCIVVAGNKAARDDLGEIFKNANQTVRFTQNIMPDIGILNTDPCHKVIRELFLDTIVKAKGIANAKTILGGVLIPTPVAVLTAARLLAAGIEGDGLGELIVIDAGGATTDVHSIAEGSPAEGVVTLGMLPEPYVKRTVEGDLGVRHNMDTLLRLAKERGIPINNNFHEGIEAFSSISALPQNETELNLDMILASVAVEVATERHAGKIEVFYSPAGKILVQHGKDLGNVKCVIGTGGPIVFSAEPGRVLRKALYSAEKPDILKPKHSKLYVDKEYILYAAGLLAQVDPGRALTLMRKYLKEC